MNILKKLLKYPTKKLIRTKLSEREQRKEIIRCRAENKNNEKINKTMSETFLKDKICNC